MYNYFNQRSTTNLIVFCLLGELFLFNTFDITSNTIVAAEPIQLSTEQRQKCLAILREGVRSTEFWPAMHAAEALTLAGYRDEVRQIVAAKIPSETDDQRRCGLAREMVRAGDRSHIGTMLGILRGENPHGHVHACESLFKVIEIGDGSELRKVLDTDPNIVKVLMAAGALGRSGNAAAMAKIRRELHSSSVDAARISSWLLGQIGSSEDIESLKQNKLRQTDPLIVAYFDHALAMRGDKSGIAATIANLNSKDPGICVYAAEFSGHAGLTQTKEPLLELLSDDTLDVRIRAAQSLLILSERKAPLGQEPIVSEPYPATKENPRYSEGSVIVLNDGSLLYSTTEFFGSESDFASARIIAKTSTDEGQTWSSSRVLQENVGKNNVMSVTLRRLGLAELSDSPIGFFYLVKNSMNDLKVHLRVSNDEAKSFSTPILVTNASGYHVMNNDRVTRLSSGRLLCPIAATEDVGSVNHFVSYCYLSDDAGKTWRKGKGKIDYPQRGALEPEVFETHDGRAGMIIRTQLGHIAISYSSDGGDTWSEATSWNVRAPEAPSTIRRIPSTGDLLLIYNDTFTPGTGHGGKRTPLTAAVSTDDGKTWQLKRNLETDSERTYAYTSIAFYRGKAVLSYYVRDEKSGQISSRFRSVPVSWFYQSR